MSIDRYEAYLKNERKMSVNTVQAYVRDIRHFAEFVSGRGVADVSEFLFDAGSLLLGIRVLLLCGAAHTGAARPRSQASSFACLFFAHCGGGADSKRPAWRISCQSGHPCWDSVLVRLCYGFSQPTEQDGFL